MKRFFLALAILGLAVEFFLTPIPLAQAQNGWGTVKGKVIFGGQKIPNREKLTVNKDQNVCLAKGPLFSDDWLINKKNLGIKNVYVWLEPVPGGDPIPVHPNLKQIKQREVEIDQPCCMFEPHCLAMRQGQILVVKNPAPITHNFHWFGHPLKIPGGNVSMPPNSTFKVKDLVADSFPVTIKCDIHPWMSGWIRVFDHPYFALTDENGEFAMPNAPGGQYRLKIWHGKSGWLGGAKGKMGMPITIKAGAVTDLSTLKIVQ